MKHFNLDFLSLRDFKTYMKYLLWIVLILGGLFLIREDLIALNYAILINDLAVLPNIYFISFFVFSILAVSTMSLYDLTLRKEFDLNLSIWDTIKIGWISNTMGNFVGENSTKYGGISSILYRTKGIDSRKANIISFIKNTLFASDEDTDEDTTDEIEFIRLSLSARIKLVFSILIKFISSYILFTYILRVFTPELTFIDCFVVFSSSFAISILSRIPGKIGIFEIVAIYLFSNLNINIQSIFAGILYFRFFYFIVPWLITLFILILSTFPHDKLKVSTEQKKLIQFIGVQAIASLIFFAGIVTILVSSMPSLTIQIPLITGFVLYDTFTFSPLLTMGSGLLLIILSGGIYNKVTSSYYLSLILITLNIILMLFKGFIFSQLLLFTIILIIVIPSKDLFYRESTSFKWPCFFKSMLVTTLISSCYILLLILLGTKDISTILSFWDIFTFIICILIASFLSTITGAQRLTFTPPKTEELDFLKGFLQKYEGNSMSHLMFLKDKNFFYCMDHQVLISYRPYKDKLMVLGDPIGDRLLFKEGINEFRIFADKYDMTPIFYEVSEENLPLYHENGFNFLKLGEEAVFSLNDFTLKGKKWAPIRTVKNKMLRDEFSFEIIEPPFSHELLNDLQKLSNDWLDKRNEKAFSLGFFDEEYLNLAPIAIIKQQDQLLGFASILPMYQKEIFSIDLMRLIPSPPNGTMDALFIGIIEWGIEMGYTEFVLGKAPLSNVGHSQFSSRREKLVKHFYNYGNRFYSFKGLRYFKEKFHPNWQGVYLAYPKNTRLSITLIQLARLISGSDYEQK